MSQFTDKSPLDLLHIRVSNMQAKTFGQEAFDTGAHDAYRNDFGDVAADDSLQDACVANDAVMKAINELAVSADSLLDVICAHERKLDAQAVDQVITGLMDMHAMADGYDVFASDLKDINEHLAEPAL
ncbi:MAG: hypothetical protein AAF607_06350 [Pseudomonadota bacterium]